MFTVRYSVHDTICVIVNAVNNILKFNHFHITAITRHVIITYIVEHVLRMLEIVISSIYSFIRDMKKLCALAATSR